MKHCDCLRYKLLQELARESRLWLFDEEYGLIPIDVLYPLIKFDSGNPVPICPYYLYLKDDVRISDAFNHKKKLTEKEIELLNIATAECKNTINSNVVCLTDRHAMILQQYATENKLVLDQILYDKFCDFIINRNKYLDISPCLTIPPIEHVARMKCINEAWFDAFMEYSKEVENKHV